MTVDLRERIAIYVDGSAIPVSTDEAVLRAGAAPSPPPQRHLLVAALGAFVIVGLVAMFAIVVRGTDSGPATTPGTTLDARKQDALERSIAEFDSGFISYRYSDPVTGDSTTGYIPTASSPESLMPYYDQVNKRVPVFAESSLESQVVGYEYSWIGFIPLDVADSGSFDARAVRISLYGCDPIEEACRPTSDPTTPDRLAP